MYVKNLDKKLLHLCLAFFCVTDKATRKHPATQRETNWNQARTWKGTAPAWGCTCLPSALGVLHSLRNCCSSRADQPLTCFYDRHARIQSRFWLTTTHTQCLTSYDQDLRTLQLSCIGTVGFPWENSVSAIWNKLLPGEIQFYHPTTYKWLMLICNSLLAMKYHFCPMFSRVILSWQNISF